MLGWVVRGLLIVAGVMTSWLVTKDAPNFGAIQMTVAVLLLILMLFVLAFWPASWTDRFNRLTRRRS